MIVSFVNSLRKVTVDLATCTTVSDILQQCASQLSESEANISLVFRGKQLKPSDVITEKGITDTSKIKVAPSPPNSKEVKFNTSNTSDEKTAQPVESTANIVVSEKKPEPVSQENKESPDSDDEIYARTELASAKYLPILQECFHLPIKVNDFLAYLRDTDPRLFNYVASHRDVLIDAIVNVDQRPHVAAPETKGNIQLSQEDVANIKKLMELGFSQQESMIAYLSCDRNVDMAASFLFENMFTVC